MSAPDDNIRKYRASTLGTTLAEALQSLVEEEKITKREAASIFGKFDDVINEEMNKETKPPPADEIWHLDGELDYYNCYDSLWHIRMKNVKCTKGGEEVVPELKTLSVLATDVNRNKKPKLSW